MPDNRNDEPGQDQKQQNAGDGKPGSPDPNSLAGLAATLASVTRTVQEIDQRNRNLQAWATRAAQDNQRLRQQVEQIGGRGRRARGYDDPDEDDESSGGQSQERIDRLENLLKDERSARYKSEQRRGFMSYRLSNADWKEHHADVMKIVDDELRVAEHASYSGETDPATGLPVLDVEKTYNNVLRAVKLSKFEQAKAAGDAERARLEAEKEAQKAKAAISGSDASGGEGDLKVVIDPEMTSDEMIEKGLVKFPKGQVPEKLGIK